MPLYRTTSFKWDHMTSSEQRNVTKWFMTSCTDWQLHSATVFFTSNLFFLASICCLITAGSLPDFRGEGSPRRRRNDPTKENRPWLPMRSLQSLTPLFRLWHLASSYELSFSIACGTFPVRTFLQVLDLRPGAALKQPTQPRATSQSYGHVHAGPNGSMQHLLDLSNRRCVQVSGRRPWWP